MRLDTTTTPFRGVARAAIALCVLLSFACGGAKPVTDKGAVDPESGVPLDPAADKGAQTMRLFLEATQARLGGQIPKAVSLYQQCLKLDPEIGRAHV